jgi:hypothetical protein
MLITITARVADWMGCFTKVPLTLFKWRPINYFLRQGLVGTLLATTNCFSFPCGRVKSVDTRDVLFCFVLYQLELLLMLLLISR